MFFLHPHHRFIFVFVFFLLCFAFVHVVYAQDADGVKSISAPSAQASVPVDQDDDFFDANDLVPQGELARQGPNSVNPTVQPASKFVVVSQNHKADSRAAHIVAAERALNLGRFSSALQMFDSLYASHKKDERVLMGRAVTLQRLGRFDEAMAMYEDLSVLKPKGVEAQVNMLGLLSTRYPAVALRRMLSLYEDNRNNASLVAQIAVTYARAGDVGSALQFLGVAASMEPDNANHLFNYAVIADRSGDTRKAVEYYERSLEVDSIHGGGRSIPREAVYDRLAQIR